MSPKPPISAKAQAILDLMARGVAYHHIAERVGVTVPYVRAVRSRYSATDAETFWKRRKATRIKIRRTMVAPGVVLPVHVRRPWTRYCEPSGQSREELKRLALMLWEMRTGERHVQQARAIAATAATSTTASG